MADNNNGNNDVPTYIEISCVKKERRVADFLLNPNLKIPNSINFYELRTIAFLSASTSEYLDCSSTLDGHGKWYWVTEDKTTAISLGSRFRKRNVGGANSWRLSSEIGNLTGLKLLSLVKCSSIPKEIAHLRSLQTLYLCNCDDRLNLPDLQVEMKALTTLGIKSGNWNEERITAFLYWVSMYVPELHTLKLHNLSRETANFFINAMIKSEFSKRNKLKSLHIRRCGLLEEDAKQVIFDLLPLYPVITRICLEKNKIESLQTIEEMTFACPPNKTLEALCLNGNPFFFNLANSESPDHGSAISILNNCKKMSSLGHSKKTIKPTSEIEYLTKVNKCGRAVVDGGGNAVNGKILSLNLWPKILELAYLNSNGGPYASTKSGEHDPSYDATALYYLIRHGPLFSIQR